MTYLGYSTALDPLSIRGRPLAEKQGSPPTTLRYVFRLFFAVPEASKRSFCALQLPTVFRTRFWRPPGSILGAILASKMVVFYDSVLITWVLFSSSCPIDFCCACPLKFDCVGRCEKKAHMAFDPQNPWIFKIFAYARRRRPRSKEGNRGQNIAKKKEPNNHQRI